MKDLIRTKWAAVGAAVAITLGAGGVSLTQAAITSGDKPVSVSLSEPCRLVDTRPATQIGPKGDPIAAGEANAYEIQVTGANGDCTGGLAVPGDAVAVALNVTAIAPVATATGRSYFTVYPADASLPTTSNLNFLNGAPPTPNKVDVGLSGDGKIKIYNNEGTAHAAVDIFGYYIDHGHTGADIVDGSLTGADVEDNSLTGADIQNSSVSNTDTSNEPGIAYNFEDSLVDITGTPSAVVATSMRAPSDGFVDVHVTGNWRNGAGGSDEAWCQIQKGAIGAIDFNEPAFEIDDRSATDTDWHLFSGHRLLPISSADNPLLIGSGQALSFVCDEQSGDVDFDNVQISATFYATSYAPVGFVFPFP